MMISGRSPSVWVEYAKGKGRARKLFTNPWKARRWYNVKMNGGKNPNVYGVADSESTLSDGTIQNIKPTTEEG